MVEIRNKSLVRVENVSDILRVRHTDETVSTTIGEDCCLVVGGEMFTTGEVVETVWPQFLQVGRIFHWDPIISPEKEIASLLTFRSDRLGNNINVNMNYYNIARIIYTGRRR